MDRNLALEVVRVTEAAALAAARFVGLGDHDGSDAAATEAMRATFGSLHIRGTVVIGEGERDEAPMLYIGEEVGDGDAGSPAIDIAVDPLEGTNLCANGAPGALAVVAMAEHGRFLNAPDTYMEKLAVGANIGPGVVDIRRSPTENLRAIAKKKGVAVSDLTAVILERPRHEKLIAEVRASGARIRLITDGDVGGAIAAGDPDTSIDVLMGTGGAPEGVLAAAALRCMNGYMQGILRPRNDEEVARAAKMGIPDIHRVWEIDDLAGGDVMFAATGITGGFLLRGVHFLPDGARSSSLVMRSRTGTVRRIETRHHFAQRPSYPKLPAAPTRAR
ncbi:MAG TPA: class II fructose-bisphosphatase [Polyangia bacterium]|nr:class II fructose-bisphosphatase [Polyangia bacterium]